MSCSISIFSILAHVLVVIFFTIFIDDSLPILERHTRMKTYHRLISARTEFFSYLHLISNEIDSDSKALDEMIKLYSPNGELWLDETYPPVETVRYHYRKMVAGLHPPRLSSCLIEHHLISYNNRIFNISSIHYNKIDNWTTSNRPLILYLHGGAFIFGDLETYSGFECHLSKQLDMTVLHINLGLIPEYPIQEIIKDIMDVYEILHHFDPNIHKRLIGMGDSSGGMLWIYLLQWIVSNNKPLPQGVVLHSPWPSLEFSTFETKMDCRTYIPSILAYFAKDLAINGDVNWYLWNNEQKEKVSPKLNSYERFPPLYITAGSKEIFITDIRSFVDQLKLVNIDVVYEEGEGLMHSYSLFHLWTPKARDTQENIRQWIQKRLPIRKEFI